MHKATNKQQNHTNQFDYSQSYHNSSSEIIGESSRQQLRIVAIPPSERMGRAFFRIVDEFGEIIADQLSDWQKAQKYFESGEEVRNV